jgi:hypothetical protein
VGFENKLVFGMNKFSIFPFRTEGGPGEKKYYALLCYEQGERNAGRSSAGPCASLDALEKEIKQLLGFLVATMKAVEEKLGTPRDVYISDSIEDYSGDVEEFLGEHLSMKKGQQAPLERRELAELSSTVRDWLMAA